MDIKQLEKIMIQNGLVIRAIPLIERCIYDKEHINDWPGGKIEYVPEFKREMAVFEFAPEHAGKFIVQKVNHVYSTVKFYGKEYFDNIEEAIKAILGEIK